ncbi:MAG: hypothetical protein AAGF89_13260, partial [Bacteroidota bacterium]
YTLPDGALGGGIENLRLAISANNLFTITNYEGLDPAVGGSADTDFGVDVGNYPVTQSFNFSIALDF